MLSATLLGIDKFVSCHWLTMLLYSSIYTVSQKTRQFCFHWFQPSTLGRWQFTIIMRNSQQNANN